jgi:hypothetical protein
MKSAMGNACYTRSKATWRIALSDEMRIVKGAAAGRYDTLDGTMNRFC